MYGLLSQVDEGAKVWCAAWDTDPALVSTGQELLPRMVFRTQGLGLGLGFWGLGFRDGLGFRNWGLGFRVLGSG